jgi:hypothetical protein|tara:strand:- start:34 stop:480 length:447 start_codon:yes stop_codon:yes gene_type:complete
MAYRTARKKIAEALANKLKEINGQHPYNSNVADNVKAKMLFLDEIEQYPKVCVVNGNESREYQPGEFKWRFLSIGIRVYVRNENDTQEELALLLEDIERVIDNNDTLVYDDTVSPHRSLTEMVIDSITTDEGVIAPLGIGEIAITVRY